MLKTPFVSTESLCGLLTGYCNSDNTVECDYDKDCTELYKHLELEDYEALRSYLDTGYWPWHILPDPCTPATAAKMWVTRRVGKQVRWSHLPIHLALLSGAPSDIVYRLLSLNPQSVRATDDEGMTALHLGMKYGADLEVIDLLIRHFPEAAQLQSREGLTPLDCARKGCNPALGRVVSAFSESPMPVDDLDVSAITMCDSLTEPVATNAPIEVTLNPAPAAPTPVTPTLTRSAQIAYEIHQRRRAERRGL